MNLGLGRNHTILFFSSIDAFLYKIYRICILHGSLSNFGASFICVWLSRVTRRKFAFVDEVVIQATFPIYATAAVVLGFSISLF